MTGVVPTSLIFEVLGCPYCARGLETMDLELAESERSRSEGEVVHEFSHGAEFKPARSRHRRRLHERSHVGRYWENFRDRMKRIVDSKYFNRGIMIAILINTLSMGIEYHEQVSARLALTASSCLLVVTTVESLTLVCFASAVVKMRI